MGSLKASGIDEKGGSARRHLLSVAGVGGLLLCGGLALALYRGVAGHIPGVTLSFVGFTNQLLAIGPKTPDAPQDSILLPAALLLAKNTGSVSAELWDTISQDKVSTNAGRIGIKDGFWPVEGAGLPHVLKPGESIQLVAFARDGVPWSTEVQYQRRAFADRFCVRLWNSGVTPLRALAPRLGTSWWQLVPVELGPITNQPPMPEALAPTTGVQLQSPARWLGPALPPAEDFNPGYSSGLIDTHSQPVRTPEEP